MHNKVKQWIRKKTQQAARHYSDEELKLRIQALNSSSASLPTVVSTTSFLALVTLFVTISTYTLTAISQEHAAASALYNQQSILNDSIFAILLILIFISYSQKYYYHVKSETLFEILRKRTK
ncbi:hypothetical protein LZY01_13150 [Levilactobacillus zymae]|uniref:Uncharacterized protein n=1 Tax=Levilactobacillus zymae TaxID=267363 RepID=A0ABQ0X137_9LACO|nr:hypothetical protein [Levilactobacillus zymae]KRL13139.1 hypothetical protein FD38_GL001264 [Levilactobacillus zymae DSM 19395]QFR61153.1 hypothetical protein LZ395_06315 [Levilactobacillus zymae]GEO72147.1 hypothetical protein LZY01_13150 [Levilactobacillus zymae]